MRRQPTELMLTSTFEIGCCCSSATASRTICPRRRRRRRTHGISSPGGRESLAHLGEPRVLIGRIGGRGNDRRIFPAPFHLPGAPSSAASATTVSPMSGCSDTARGARCGRGRNGRVIGNHFDATIERLPERRHQRVGIVARDRDGIHSLSDERVQRFDLTLRGRRRGSTKITSASSSCPPRRRL